MDFKYESTRDGAIQASGKEAVLKGISSDGGLFVNPKLSENKLDLERVCQQTYKENAVDVLALMLPDYTREELETCVNNAYTDTFASDCITPLKKVDDVYVLELFHGPTSAFKDVALTLLPQLMSAALKGTGKKALILTATSGDTGKAALSGFQDVENTAICVFYPDGKVSDIQYRQMATQKGSNVRVFGVRGNFDDAQSQVKKLFLDEDLAQTVAKEQVTLTSANSINIGRLVPQIVYYFEAYKQLVHEGTIKPGDEISFSVPTGNFGDVLAGYYAYLMGLPVKKFYVASNANHVLSDFLATGKYDRNRDFVQTISPSMDILISSNFERLLYYATGRDHEKVAGWMKDLAETGSYQVDEETFKKIQELFAGGYFDDEATRKIIREVYEKTGTVLDPHSAIGYGLAKEADGVVVSLATASPYKFSADVLDAIHGEKPEDWQALHDLQKINRDPVPAALAALEEADILHNRIIDIDQMKDEVAMASQELFA